MKESMQFRKMYAGKDDDLRRLDKVVRNILNRNSLSGIYQALRKGLITVNGKKAAQDFRVKEGDCIAVAEILFTADDARRPEATAYGSDHNTKTDVPAADSTMYGTHNAARPALSADILIKTEDVLVINKPYDRTVQGKGSLAEQVAAAYVAGGSLSFTPGPLHRLDKKTTGTLLFSQSLNGARWVSRAFADHLLGKTYIGIAQGTLRAPEHWTDDIIKSGSSKAAGFHTVALNTGNGKAALTDAYPLAYGAYGKMPVTLIEYAITTGRTHQIRSQTAAHGFPLLGDTAYGGMLVHEPQDLYLHALQITVPRDNPLGLPETIRAPILTNFQKMLNKTLIQWDGLLYSTLRGT